MKKLVFTFGRMNPPTIGHEKLANKIKEVARKENANPRIYLSHTQNPKKDPLSYNDKFRFAKKAFGIVQRSQSKQIFQILPEIEKEGFTDIIMVVGSDRIGEFDRVLQKYNGKDYNFNSIKTVSSGDRDPDAQGVEGMSGSKLRGVAMSGDEKIFKSGLASKLSDADKTKIYNLVRKNLKEAIMNEWTEEDDLIVEEALEEAEFDEKDYEALVELGKLYEINEVLNVTQRLAKSRVMKRIGKKLARARKIASKKMKSAGKLAQMAKKAAIAAMRKKLGGQKGANYASLSPSDKMNIDKKVQKKKSVIAKMAQRLLPKVRKDAMSRVAMARKGAENAEYIPEGAYDSDKFFGGKGTPAQRTQLLKLQNKALKAFPSSPKQKEIKKEIDALRKEIGMNVKEAMVPVGKMTGKGFKPAKKDKDTKLPPHLKDLKTIRKAFAKSKKVKEAIEEKYDLYHSTFSDAMQHAYDYAKKKFGIQIPDSEIDSKVATGPKKPGTGKTNTYRLKGRGGNLQIQVYNKGGSKPFELNMYKEEVELDEDMRKLSKQQQRALSHADRTAKKKVTLPFSDFSSKKKTPSKVGRQSQIVKYEVAQDKDIKDRDGTQPKSYFKGVKKSTKDDRDRAFKKGADKHHDDPSAYPDSHPGDAKAKTKLSKHTKRYRDMFGEALKHTHMVLDPDGKVMSMHSSERHANDSAKPTGNLLKKQGKVVKLRKPMSTTRGDRLIGQLPAHNLGEGPNLKSVNTSIEREKEADAKKFDRLRDRARTADTKITNRKEDVDIDEISTKKINRYYDKAKQSHDRAGNSAFARSLRKEPGIEKDLDTMRKRKAGIKTAKSIAIKKLRGEKPGKLKSEDNLDEKGKGLWHNIHKKRKEGRPMRKPGSKGAPKSGDFERARGEAIDHSANMTEDATGALKKKAEKSGMPLGILRQVYNRGMAAWRTGHRPGASQQQWAFARVNSFITKSSGTWGKADKDLAAKVRGSKSKKESIYETGGAGEQGTSKLLAQYKKDTPGELKQAYNPDDDFSGKLKKKFKEIRNKDGFDSVKEGVDEMTGINVPELIKTTIHRLTHPKGYADIMKAYIKRAKEPHKGTNGSILADIARERGFDRVKPIQDYINRLINKGKLPKSLMASTVNEEVEIDEDGCPIDLFDHVLEEAEYQGKKVTLNDPIRSSDGKKKFHVYVKNEKGNIIKVGFGDPNMEIKRDDPGRRKSFRARHNCDNPGPKYKARYWSCYQWRGGSKVDN